MDPMDPDVAFWLATCDGSSDFDRFWQSEQVTVRQMYADEKDALRDLGILVHADTLIPEHVLLWLMTAATEVEVAWVAEMCSNCFDVIPFAPEAQLSRVYVTPHALESVPTLYHTRTALRGTHGGLTFHGDRDHT